ncbi:MAG: EAL domain-containing protein, partial [Pseudomonadota bacterium]
SEGRGKFHFDGIRTLIADFVGAEAGRFNEYDGQETLLLEIISGNAPDALATTEGAPEALRRILGAKLLLNAAVDMETGIRGFLLTGNEVFLEPYNTGKASLSEQIHLLSDAVSGDPAQLAKLAQIEQAIDVWRARVMDPMLALRREVGSAKTMDDMADLVGEAFGKTYFDSFREVMAAFEEEERGLMVTRHAKNEAMRVLAFTMIIGSVVLAVVLGGVVAWWIGLDIRRAIRQMIEAMSRLAGRHYDTAVEGRERRDEFGAMARSLEKLRSDLVSGEAAVKASIESMQRAQEDNARAARHDALTGLGNRKLLDEISAGPKIPSAGNSRFLVLAIDLDRFKYVNDTFGHEAGDAVLKGVAECLLARAGEAVDHLAFRIGGDEFVLLVPFEGTDMHAQWHCDHFLDALLVPQRFKGIDLRVGASIGFDTVGSGEPLAHALRRADLALYEAKSNGRSQAVAYSATLGASHEAKLKMINDFELAIERDQISIELQPQVNAKTHDLTGAEVLARWDHPERGRLAPNVFLGLAEELKMMPDLDRRILDLALKAREEIVAELGHPLKISVNVSARRLASPDLVAELRSRSDFPTSGLSFEILETAFLDDPTAELENTISDLKAMGIEIEVDDFGTGHASFASVLALKPDRLKLDRIFVPGVDKDPKARDIMRGILDMANRMSVTTVVEGVETLGEAEAIARIGADNLQGYFFSRPVSPVDFIRWAKSWKRQVA